MDKFWIMEQNKLNELEQAIRAVCKETIKRCLPKNLVYPDGGEGFAPCSEVEYEPLTLEHVLRAINDAQMKKLPDWLLSINSGGVFLFNNGKWVKFTDKRYDLTKPLAQQDQSVIDFLHKIICEKD